MPAFQGVVRAPEIVNEFAPVVWQDAAGADSFDAAFGAVSVMSAGRIASDVEPVGFASAADAGFVGMEDGDFRELVADFIHGGGQASGTLDHRQHHAASAGTVSKEVLTNFRSAGAGEELADVEVAHDR